jgi:hypothetical protein
MSKNALHRLYDHLTRAERFASTSADRGYTASCISFRHHNMLTPRTGARRRLAAILGPISPGLCGIVDMNFRELFF